MGRKHKERAQQLWLLNGWMYLMSLSPMNLYQVICITVNQENKSDDNIIHRLILIYSFFVDPTN